jgi:tetratricopeptide (TPR) repeat protein
MACATRAGDDGLRLRALRLLAFAETFQGDIEACRALVLQGLAEARRLGLRGTEGLMLSSLRHAVVLQRDGNTMLVLELARQSLWIWRELGNRVNEAEGLTILGNTLMRLGDLAQARRELDAALRLLHTNGDRSGETLALTSLSLVALWQGEETRGRALARQSLDMAVATQSPFDEMVAGLRLGGAELALGRTAAARQAYTQARMRALEVGSPAYFDADAGLACVALAEGDIPSALTALQPVMDHMAAGGALARTGFPRLIEFTCHQTLARAGDPRSDGWLELAYTALMAEAEALERSGGDSERGLSGAALREGFLRNIPHHREIVVAWARRSAGGDVAERSPG